MGHVCDDCGGDGGGIEVYAAPGTLDGTRSEEWTCRACDGTGYIEDEDDPMTLEDALMLDAEILRAKGIDVDDPIFLEDAE